MSRTYHKQKESNKRGSKAFSSHCANHGTCGWCQGNRHHKFERAAKQFHEDEYSASAHYNDEYDLEFFDDWEIDSYAEREYDIANPNNDWIAYQRDNES